MQAFFFSSDEQAAASLRVLKTTVTGQLRRSPDAPWIPFAAEQEIHSTRTPFFWKARLHPGKLTSVTVTEAFEAGHGKRTITVGGGLIPLKKMAGRDVDKAERQRHLASIVLCPAILLNHGSLEFHAIGPSTLRFHDKQDTLASVELDISEQGHPMACRANAKRCGICQEACSLVVSL